MKIADLPEVKLAHQVIYIPPETGYKKIMYTEVTKNQQSAFHADEKSQYFFTKRSDLYTADPLQGTVFLFGGKPDTAGFSRSSYKYDIALDTWTKIKDVPR